MGGTACELWAEVWEEVWEEERQRRDRSSGILLIR
jgi:hypothetical protein